MICNKTAECFPVILKNQSSVSCNNITKCVNFCDKRKNAKCQENGKVYSLENSDSPYKILSIHIDGGIIIVDKNTPAGLQKCDYLFLIDTDNAPVAILIELKGRDINHAVEQIDSTINILSDFLITCSSVHGRIVFSGGTPNIQNVPKFMKLQKRLKRMSGTLNAKGRVLPDKMANVLT